MPDASTICGICLCGLGALSLGACASNEVYDPEPKFSKFQSAPEPVELTGSRVTRYGSQYELTRDALSPTSVITEDFIDQQGESNLARLLCRQFPNMMSSRFGSQRASQGRGFRYRAC